MTTEEFKFDYLSGRVSHNPVAFAQLMIDEITPVTDYEIQMISDAQDYLVAARKLHRSSSKLKIEVFA